MGTGIGCGEGKGVGSGIGGGEGKGVGSGIGSGEGKGVGSVHKGDILLGQYERLQMGKWPTGHWQQEAMAMFVLFHQACL